MAAFNSKKTVKRQTEILKTTTAPRNPTNSKKMVWIFDSVDKAGMFNFDPLRDDMDSKKILTKVIEYSDRTWQEVMSETHDRSKSKNHFLDYDGICSEAQQRIRSLHLEEDIDCLFSLRIENKIRIIGFRKEERFIVKWYDPEHQFYPISR